MLAVLVSLLLLPVRSIVYLEAAALSLRVLRSLLITRNAGMVVFVEPGHRYEAELVAQAGAAVVDTVLLAPAGPLRATRRTYPLNEAVVLAVAVALQPARESDVRSHTRKPCPESWPCPCGT